MQLAEIHEAKKQMREHLRLETRDRLRQALHRLLPGAEIIVFGSLTRQHAFHPRSDVDIAIHSVPAHMSIYRLQAEIEDFLDRPVDLVELSRCRFRAAIEQQGERWIG
jgi:predicted nucleotidyltransferase